MDQFFDTNAICSHRLFRKWRVDTPLSIWPIMLSSDRSPEVLHSFGKSLCPLISVGWIANLSGRFSDQIFNFWNSSSWSSSFMTFLKNLASHDQFHQIKHVHILQQSLIFYYTPYMHDYLKNNQEKFHICFSIKFARFSFSLLKKKHLQPKTFKWLMLGFLQLYNS